VLACVQIMVAVRFAKSLLARPEAMTNDNQLPHVLAVLPLRGGDEFLEETLKRLTSLDYPRYLLRIVIDSESDSAQTIVDDFLERYRPDNVETMHLGQRPLSCSGKIAGLLRGTESLPSECGVVAVFDGDAVLHPSCLRELVEPLLKGAGLTSGNRWYAPSSATLGGMMRFIWNGVAVHVMNTVQIPWGGCMAMHASSMQDPELRKRLSIAFGEDSTVATYMLETERKVTFVPDALVINLEDCSVRSLYNFLVRQYLTVGLHNPRWDIIFWSNIILGTSILAAYGFLFTSGIHWEPTAIGLGMVTLGICLQLVVSGFGVRRRKLRAGTTFRRFSVLHWLLLFPALCCTNLLNLAAVLHATFAREHTWRGITYRFGDHSTVELVDVRLPNTETATELLVDVAS
jgi:cellulose synthase/poly-beta-1,6-N-acetylglucosamine synthase-like glycosyltransferase